MNNITRFMEKFWLVVAILTTAHTVYLLATNGEVTKLNYIFPVIAFVLYFARMTVRKKIEKSKRESE